MNLLFVAPDYPPESHGGGGVVYKILAERMVQKGHKVTVIAGYHGRNIKIENRDSSNEPCIIWLPLMSLLSKRFPQIQDSLPPSARSFVYLSKINYASFDVIHFLAFGHMLIDYVNLLARCNNKVITIHAFPKYFEQNSSNFFMKSLYLIYTKTLAKYSISKADTITVVTEFVAEEFRKRYGSGNKLKVVLNGINLENFLMHQSSNLELYNVTKDDIVIASIGRIVWHKGFEYAISAIGKLIHEFNIRIKYIIIGAKEDKTYYNKLINRISELHIEENVIFTGFIEEEVKRQILSRANIFLAPSLHEGFGLTILEAMALKKPIIASNCEGFSCILQNGNTGLLVRPADFEEIAKAIRLLLDSPSLTNKMSEAVEQEIRRYDWSNIVNSYENIYREIAC